MANHYLIKKVIYFKKTTTSSPFMLLLMYMLTMKGEHIMVNVTRDFFIALSNSEFLNKNAKKYGFSLGAEQFVGGTDMESVLNTVKELNAKGISCTVDNLGEFVNKKSESTAAKNKILQLIERISEEQVDCHLSIKLTQLGLDIDYNFCYENTEEIINKAAEHDIFINVDIEDYARYDQTLDIVEELAKTHKNVGTVFQSYLYRAEADMDRFKDVRLRIVKGAYKESDFVAYQSDKMIDENFIHLVKKRLKGNTFTSIATHDHKLINEIKQFIKEENIDKDLFEFQMLYGFRTEMHEGLANEGYHFCTYIPFGDEWYGYFMRRLAERPQNINLVLKDKLYDENNQIKKKPLIIASTAVAALSTAVLLCRRKK